MNLPKPTRRDFAAALVGAIVAALLFLLAGHRWQVVPAPTDTAPIAYQLDRITGRAWMLAGATRSPLRDSGDAPRNDTTRAAVAFAVVAGALVGGVVLLSRRNS